MSKSVSHSIPRLAMCGVMLISLSGCSLFGKAPPQAAMGSADTLYNNGVDALRTGRYALATAEFEVLQQNYPYSGYTASAQLMEGYAYYLQDKYPESAQQLDRFIELHPTSADAAYAFYLLALCYYEQIADVRRDQQLTIEAMSALEDVVVRFPESKYARDAQLKIDLCRDHLAGKEMLIGRYYEQQHNYEGAVNRFQHVVQNYQTTNHVAEALHRLVEVYMKLGLTDQARKTASVLAYNYPGSKWYRYSYNDLKSYHLLSPSTPIPGKPVTEFATPAQQETESLSHGFSKTEAPLPPALSRAPVSPVQSSTLPSPAASPAAAHPAATSPAAAGAAAPSGSQSTKPAAKPAATTQQN